MAVFIVAKQRVVFFLRAVLFESFGTTKPKLFVPKPNIFGGLIGYQAYSQFFIFRVSIKQLAFKAGFCRFFAKKG
ncbi:MAG: hypothetical protein JHC61_03470 [Burkholderiaceae bacterium]|nr:hypothetical protein [Burkholderiaceae bacterium]